MVIQRKIAGGGAKNSTLQPGNNQIMATTVASGIKFPLLRQMSITGDINCLLEIYLYSLGPNLEQMPEFKTGKVWLHYFSNSIKVGK